MAGNDTTESKILRNYYSEKDFISSLDGILKVLSVIACIVTGVLSFAGGSCARGPVLARGAAGGAVALAAAASLALLTAAALLHAPQRAPLLWLYTDIITSSVVGVLLMVSVILGVVFCQLDSTLGYVYFVAGTAAVCLATGGALLGAARALRRVDAARPRTEPRAHTPHTRELDA